MCSSDFSPLQKTRTSLRLLDLPSEVLRLIFNKVPAQQLRKSLHVSKRWYRLTTRLSYTFMTLHLVPRRAVSTTYSTFHDAIVPTDNIAIYSSDNVISTSDDVVSTLCMSDFVGRQYMLYARHMTLFTPSFLLEAPLNPGQAWLPHQVNERMRYIFKRMLPDMKSLESINVRREPMRSRPRWALTRHHSAYSQVDPLPLDVVAINSMVDVISLARSIQMLPGLKSAHIDIRPKDCADFENLVSNLDHDGCWCEMMGKVMANLEICHIRLPCLCSKLFKAFDRKSGNLEITDSGQLYAEPSCRGSRIQEIIINTSMGFDEGSDMHLARNCDWYSNPTSSYRAVDLRKEARDICYLQTLRRFRIVYHKSRNPNLGCQTDTTRSYDVINDKTFLVETENWTDDGIEIEDNPSLDVYLHETPVDDYVDMYDSDMENDFDFYSDSDDDNYNDDGDDEIYVDDNIKHGNINGKIDIDIATLV